MLKSDKRETQEMSRGPEKKRTLDGLPKIQAFTVPLWTAIGRIHKFQTLGSEHPNPEESELPNEW